MLQVAYNGIITPIQERRLWRARLADAANYMEWSTAAHELDRVVALLEIFRVPCFVGKAGWKQDPVSDDYDYELVQTRLEQLQKADEMQDNAAISFLLRTSLTRDFGGTDSSLLFEKCRIGTKKLVEDFNDEIVSMLKRLGENVAHLSNPLELKLKMDFFKELRHSLGNTALLLSGGGSLGVYHIGVLKALFENGLLPRIIAGSSAGSIMAAIACCGSEDQWPKLLRLDGINVHMLEEAVPEEQKGSWFYPLGKKISRLFNHGVVFDGEILKKSLRDNIGDITFLEAYHSTNRVLNVAVSSSSMYDMPRLLNYITSPNVLVWSAVVASCALPALYESAPLLAKDHNGNVVPWNATGDRWIDGSVENDLPMNRLSELFNVNHFIVSQVNPHIYPFVKHAVGTSSYFRTFNHKILHLIRSELNYRLDQLANLGIMPKACQMLKSVLSQKYYGDITIIPDLAWNDIIHMLVDRPIEAIMKAIHYGECAAWPKISIIRSHLLAELTLDEILLSIRDRLLYISRGDISLSLTNTESELGELEQSTDVMLDPTVNIRRHVSPVLSVRSLGTLSQSGASLANGTHPTNGTSRRVKSYGKLRETSGALDLIRHTTTE